MQPSWLAYVPTYIAQDLLAHPAGPLVGREQRFDAVVLIADLSGFTPLSEALGHHGRNGTEELSMLLNHTFGPMLDLIAAQGGTVGKWSGDGMIVVFPVGSDRATVAEKAVQCAAAMQTHMRSAARLLTSAGEFELFLRIGLAVGPVLSVIVGDPALRLEYVLAGTVLDRCAAAEQQAARGEIVLDAELAPCAQAWEPQALPSGDLRLLAINPQTPVVAQATLLDIPSTLSTQPLPFVHPQILERLRSGQSSFINEHRRVTMLFVRFSGFDYDHDPRVGARLVKYLAEVVACVERFNGYLMQVDMDDKGSKYIILCGAPVAHEQDEVRALRCALALRTLDPTVGIGINTGVVFCGNLGATHRQHYTVLGDAVNLAARLMQAAQPGQILATATTRQAASSRGTWQPLVPILVKGRSAPVAIWALHDFDPPQQTALDLPSYALPMIGRTAELEQIQTWLGEAKHSHGYLVAICAEAGMGKSRLTAEILRVAQAQGLDPLRGECISFGSEVPYLVWQPVLRGLLGLASSRSPAAQASQLAEQFAALGPSFAERLPLLGPLLNLALPPNALTASMDQRQQKEARETLVVDLVRWYAAQTPLLIALEDCHWIDPLSLDLLHALARVLASAPILVLVVQRPSAPDSLLAPLERLPYVHVLPLAPFSDAEAATLIRHKLTHVLGTSAPLPPELISQLTARAAGNPFYLDELINLIQDRALDVHDPATLASLELPASLHSLILSRIDPLSERDKITLKIASVIGPVFRAAWIWGVQPDLAAPAEIMATLGRLQGLDLTPLERADPELIYAFKHGVVQEVAYESITYATRAMLHEQVAALIEERYADELDRYLDLLALHYGRSNNTERQRLYLCKAGDAAAEMFANDAAISYYQQAIPLLEVEAQVEVKLKLAKLLERVGRWPAADALYVELIEVAIQRNDSAMAAQIRTNWAGLMYQQGNFPQGEALIAEALRFYEAANDPHGLRRANDWVGALATSKGEYARAEQAFKQQLALAQQEGDQACIWAALDRLAMLAIYQGDLERALALINDGLAERSTDSYKVQAVWSRLAYIHNERGEYEQALQYFSHEFETSFKMGNLRALSHDAIHVGQVYLQQGDYARSDDCCRFLLQIALRLGDQVGLAVALVLLAESAVADQRPAEAVVFADAALVIGRGINLAYVTGFLLTRAKLAMAQADWRMAWSAAHEAFERATATQQRDLIEPTQSIMLRAAIKLGQTTPAIALAELEAALTTGPSLHVRAALLHTCWQIEPNEARRRAAIAAYETLLAGPNRAEQRQHYAELTDVVLPNPKLPPLPAVITANLVPIRELMTAVERFIAAQPYS